MLTIVLVSSVHWERATSPLGASLVAAAVLLAVTLLVVRRRRSVHPGARHASRAPSDDGTSPGSEAMVTRGRARLSALGRLPLGLQRQRADLSGLLAPYRLVPVGAGQSGQPGDWALLTLPQLKRLSLNLEDLMARTPLGGWLSSMLERAGARVRLGEILTIWLLAGSILVALAWVLAGLVGIILILILLVATPPAALQGAVDHRAKLFAAQLPDVLKLTASSLRAGFSLLQDLEAVTKQLHEPCATELQRVLAEARLGRPVEDALEDAAARIGNRDFSESVAAVRIQQEAGGNLATLFDTLAETMVQRLRLRREVRTLTAEARLSAYILGAMPLLLGVLLLFINRPYVLELFNTTPGRVMLVAGLVLQLLGFFWMYRTVKIET